MTASDQSGGSSDGFTLIEVIVAAAILATSAAAIVTIHVRATERAAEVRDLLFATSTARNALEEAFALAGQPGEETVEEEEGGEALWFAEGPIPERPSLVINCRQDFAPPEDEQLVLTDDFHADVWREGAPFVAFAGKRAVFLEAPEEEEPGEGEGEEGELEVLQ
jgi:prepilin-type N-terminal cleavage/methylation domain-containing protein